MNLSSRRKNNYRKEVKKKGWQPWDCLRVIMENSGPYSMKEDEVDAIVKKLKEGHNQIACDLHFSAVHLKELTSGGVFHPC